MPTHRLTKKVRKYRAGKLADLVVLSDDIFTIAPENIRNVKVIMTIFDGKVIYQVNK